MGIVSRESGLSSGFWGQDLEKTHTNFLGGREKLDFVNWYYKEDSTHVFFYHERAIDWICKNYKFTSYTNNRNLKEFRR